MTTTALPDGTYRCTHCSSRSTVVVHPDGPCPEWVWVDGPGPWVDELARRRQSRTKAVLV